MAINRILQAFLVLLVCSCTIENQNELAEEWRGNLQLNDSINLPVDFGIHFSELDSILTLKNGKEDLSYRIERSNDEGFQVRLEPYNSELYFRVDGDKLTGEWRYLVKGPEYIIGFEAIPVKDSQVEFRSEKTEKYQVQFGEGKNAYPAILLMQQDKNQLRGTFKTETGDYRFLAGEQNNETISLSCFDGAHAFVFTATIKGDSLINGVFYSGNHYSDSWTAFANDSFELTDPTKLTKVVADSTFRFSLKSADGRWINEKNYDLNNRVTCIQIMGTWCPNCKDETEFLKQVRRKYPKDKVQVFAAAFEYEKDTLKAFNRIKKYSESMEMNYPIYYGGGTSKNRVTDVFPDLDKVISYPTLIILDKNGKPQLVHTGFNGPATDEYQHFEEDTYSLIDSLILN